MLANWLQNDGVKIIRISLKGGAGDMHVLNETLFSYKMLYFGS